MADRAIHIENVIERIDTLETAMEVVICGLRDQYQKTLVKFSDFDDDRHWGFTIVDLKSDKQFQAAVSDIVATLRTISP